MFKYINDLFDNSFFIYVEIVSVILDDKRIIKLVKDKIKFNLNIFKLNFILNIQLLKLFIE